MDIVKLAGQENICIRIPNKKLPKGKDKFGHTYGEYLFPSEEIMLVSLSKSHGDLYILWFYCNGQKVYAYVPSSFKVTKMRGKKTLAIMKSYQEYLFRDLRSTLYWSGHIGSDPEIFVEDRESKLIPAFDFLGSKAKPSKADNQTGYGGNNVYWDGFQAEFDTRPNTCLSYHVDSVRDGLHGVLKHAKKHNKDARLSLKTTMDIPSELLQSAKDEHVQFGCMPSFNVYGMEGIKNDGRVTPYRSAGGHIHFGIGKKTQKEIVNGVKALDAILGVACVSLFAKYDDPRRRTMYGLAGEYRLPAHGIEYRTLSNVWLCHPVIMNLVFDLGRKALLFGMKDMMQHWLGDEKETIEVINNCNVDGARAILERNKKTLIAILSTCYGEATSLQVYNIIMGGLETVIDNPNDLESNWNLNKHWTTHCDQAGKGVQNSYTNFISQGKKVA